MKVSTPFLSLLVLCSSLFSQNPAKEDKALEKYISKYKKEQFDYDHKKNEAESSKLRDSWIDPIILNYSLSKSKPFTTEQTNKNASIKLNQTIFQSGGIYYAIKYAQASRKYANYSIDVQKRKLVKDAISLLIQIKQMDMKIQRQKLQIKNSEISLSQKKEQYLSGQLDSGFLDNAVIERNLVIQALYDIETSKQRLISSFEAISDIDYESAFIPKLEELKKEEFLQHNIVIKFTASDIEKKRDYKNVTIAKYLPVVKVQAGYSWSKSEGLQFYAGKNLINGSNEKRTYNYGFSASMPLNINTFTDIESSKVDYLKSQVALEDKKRQLSALYDQVMHNIENFNKKKLLSLENKDIYTRLLDETKKLFEAGYKTEYDVGLLQNSVAISETDYKIYELDKQLELLTLYEMYKKDN